MTGGYLIGNTVLGSDTTELDIISTINQQPMNYKTKLIGRDGEERWTEDPNPKEDQPSLLMSEDNFVDRMAIATAVAGMNLSEYGLLLMYRLLVALQKRGGELTIDEMTDIKTSAINDIKKHNESVPKK